MTITAGPLNGAPGAFGGVSAQWGWDARIHPKRLLTFMLDGGAKIPPTAPARRAQPLAAPEFRVDPAEAKSGAREYGRCVLCHGPAAVAGGNAPDLRASGVPLSRDAFEIVVRRGSLVDRGMPKFSELDDAQLEALRHFIRAMATPTTN